VNAGAKNSIAKASHPEENSPAEGIVVVVVEDVVVVVLSDSVVVVTGAVVVVVPENGTVVVVVLSTGRLVVVALVVVVTESFSVVVVDVFPAGVVVVVELNTYNFFFPSSVLQFLQRHETMIAASISRVSFTGTEQLMISSPSKEIDLTRGASIDSLTV
jgi:hypothetical protein